MYYRSSKGKRFRPQHIVLAIVVFLICMLGPLSFFKKEFFYFFSRMQKTAPLPTAIDPNFITQVNECFIPTAAVYGYDLRITAGFRSIADQEQLYEQGRTVDGHIVTEAAPYRSIHNYGFAVDVVDRIKGYDIDWQKLIKIGAYCGLESGGPGDLPHFEHRAGLSTYDFQAGKRPPPLTLPCPAMAQRAAAGEKLTLQDLQTCNAPAF